MRNMLAFLAALALTFIGFGWYLDWFTLRNTPAPAGRRSVTVDFDTKKIAADVLKVEHKIEEKIAEKAKESAANPKPSEPLVLPRPSQPMSIPSLTFEGKVEGKLPDKPSSGVSNVFEAGSK